MATPAAWTHRGLRRATAEVPCRAPRRRRRRWRSRRPGRHRRGRRPGRRRRPDTGPSGPTGTGPIQRTSTGRRRGLIIAPPTPARPSGDDRRAAARRRRPPPGVADVPVRPDRGRDPRSPTPTPTSSRPRSAALAADPRSCASASTTAATATPTRPTRPTGTSSGASTTPASGLPAARPATEGKPDVDIDGLQAHPHHDRRPERRRRGHRRRRRLQPSRPRRPGLDQPRRVRRRQGDQRRRRRRQRLRRRRPRLGLLPRRQHRPRRRRRRPRHARRRHDRGVARTARASSASPRRSRSWPSSSSTTTTTAASDSQAIDGHRVRGVLRRPHRQRVVGRPRTAEPGPELTTRSPTRGRCCSSHPPATTASTTTRPVPGRCPPSFDLPNILSVAAIDNDGGIADFSNYGDDSVDIAAPGVAHPEHAARPTTGHPQPG